jgi:hypothetical protein
MTERNPFMPLKAPPGLTSATTRNFFLTVSMSCMMPLPGGYWIGSRGSFSMASLCHMTARYFASRSIPIVLIEVAVRRLSSVTPSFPTCFVR